VEKSAVCVAHERSRHCNLFLTWKTRNYRRMLHSHATRLASRLVTKRQPAANPRQTSFMFSFFWRLTQSRSTLWHKTTLCRYSPVATRELWWANRPNNDVWWWTHDRVQYQCQIPFRERRTVNWCPASMVSVSFFNFALGTFSSFMFFCCCLSWLQNEARYS